MADEGKSTRGRRATIRVAVGGAAVASAAVTAMAMAPAAGAATAAAAATPPVSITTIGQLGLTPGATVTIEPCWIVGSTDIRIPVSQSVPVPVPAGVGNRPPVSITTTGQLAVNPANADHPAPSVTVTIEPCWIVGSTDIRIPISETIPL